MAGTRPRTFQPAAPGTAPAKDMVWVPGGSFLMGSEDFYPEEQPVHRGAGGRVLDGRPSGNQRRISPLRQGHRPRDRGRAPPDPADYPDADPDLLVPGSLVFRPTSGPVDLRDWRNWWAWVPGAGWRHPEGPGSTLHGRDRHPVVQVAYADAVAYAAWAGKSLPSEAEWEYAARGGLEGKVFCWGDEFAPKGKLLANTWQGEFPWQNLLEDRYERTSPVKSFPPNGYGLYDMAGNVWEWTSDYYTPRHADEMRHACCGPPSNPRVTTPDMSHDVGQPGQQFPRRVVKGGSHLCAPNYCLRYRPAARQAQSVDTSMGHLGFRCIVRVPAPA